MPGLDRGLVTMRKGEISLFTVPSALGYGDAGAHGVLPGSDLQYEVELISWLAVVDVCKDGGIMKKILLRGDGGQPGDLDEVAGTPDDLKEALRRLIVFFFVARMPSYSLIILGIWHSLFSKVPSKAS